MAETLTANFSWTKPDPGGSPNTWGATLNADLDKIDDQVFTNQTAAAAGQAPIGSITMFGGATPPTGWLICDGSSLSTAVPYAALFAVLQYTYGGSGANFNLPNLLGAFPLGAGAGAQIDVALGATGGEAAHALTASETGPHYHNVPDPGHAHGASQGAHSHVIVTGNHAHAISTGAHAHSGVAVGISGAGTGPIAGQAGGGGLQMGNTSTAGNLGGNTDTAGNLGGYTDTQQPGVTVNAAATGISTTDTQGGGGAHNTIPPYIALNFIIRYQ
jgi:microcystin-dependent protein